MSYEPIRPWTEQQRRILDGIERELSYEEIGAELGLSPHTVRQYVRDMALLLDEPRELPPRWRLLFHRRFEQWKAAHLAGQAVLPPPKVSERVAPR